MYHYFFICLFTHYYDINTKKQKTSYNKSKIFKLRKCSKEKHTFGILSGFNATAWDVLVDELPPPTPHYPNIFAYYVSLPNIRSESLGRTASWQSGVLCIPNTRWQTEQRNCKNWQEKRWVQAHLLKTSLMLTFFRIPLYCSKVVISKPRYPHFIPDSE